MLSQSDFNIGTFNGHRQFTSVILATQEAEIRRLEVQNQPGLIV
jgi:hypothetical protein